MKISKDPSECDFCARTAILCLSESYGGDGIGFCVECAKEFIAAQQSVQRTACLGGNTHIVIEGSDMCMICGANLEASRR